MLAYSPVWAGRPARMPNAIPCGTNKIAVMMPAIMSPEKSSREYDFIH